MQNATCLLALAFALVLTCETSQAAGKDSTTLRVGVLMFTPVKWDKAANRQALDGEIRKAAHAGARIIVTPEGALDGYVVNQVTRATGEKKDALVRKFNQLAEPCDGPHTRHFQQLARELGVYLVLGLLEASGGKTYNTAILIGPEGTLAGKYRKTHFAPGDDITGYTQGWEYPVFEVDGVKVGIMICYDRRVPEVARQLAQNGARLILNPAYGMQGDCNREFISSRARENAVPVVLVHPNQTVFSDARGEVKSDIRPKSNDVRVLKVPITNAIQPPGAATKP